MVDGGEAISAVAMTLGKKTRAKIRDEARSSPRRVCRFSLAILCQSVCAACHNWTPARARRKLVSVHYKGLLISGKSQRKVGQIACAVPCRFRFRDEHRCSSSSSRGVALFCKFHFTDTMLPRDLTCHISVLWRAGLPHAIVPTLPLEKYVLSARASLYLQRSRASARREAFRERLRLHLSAAYL